MCFTYSLQYYDKALLSQAAIFGLRKDLDLETGLRFSWVSLIFYFGYIIGCYPVSYSRLNRTIRSWSKYSSPGLLKNSLLRRYALLPVYSGPSSSYLPPPVLPIPEYLWIAFCLGCWKVAFHRPSCSALVFGTRIQNKFSVPLCGIPSVEGPW